MSRYDKYDPIGGGHRAPLFADLPEITGNPLGVGIDTSGRCVIGAGNTGIVGVICATKAMKAGEIIDIMKFGEVVEMTGVTAGTVLTAETTTGVLSNGAASATQVAIGYTVEATRLIVCRAI